MKIPARGPATVLSFFFALTGASCRTADVQPHAPIIQPGAPGQPSRPATSGTAAEAPHVAFTPADVAFMQGMIHHHAQALDMTALVPDRTAHDDVRTLAKRIEVSQSDEIAMMRRWLQSRGQEAPGEHAHHMPGAPLMPGMLTAEEMARLANAKGAEFDRLFLEGMIKHHGGALVMVRDLFATPGAGQESEIFAFASEVDSGQRMEIARMDMMLKELQK